MWTLEVFKARAFRLALLQSTETCKNKEAACSGGTYDPAHSPRFDLSTQQDAPLEFDQSA